MVTTTYQSPRNYLLAQLSLVLQTMGTTISEVRVAVGGRQSLQQTLLITHPPPARLFENHQLPDHLFLIGVQEPSELPRSQKLQRTCKRGETLDRSQLRPST